MFWTRTATRPSTLSLRLHCHSQTDTTTFACRTSQDKQRCNTNCPGALPRVILAYLHISGLVLWQSAGRCRETLSMCKSDMPIVLEGKMQHITACPSAGSGQSFPSQRRLHDACLALLAGHLQDIAGQAAMYHNLPG